MLMKPGMGLSWQRVRCSAIGEILPSSRRGRDIRKNAAKRRRFLAEVTGGLTRAGLPD